ncbi:MAG: hypothetical protein NTY51_08415 [Deltaproteobacteria bacterium]|nr:hypothetical protein [Deltaproteobacteria bacterium]
MKNGPHGQAGGIRTTDVEDFAVFLRAEGLLFDQRELVSDMSQCISQFRKSHYIFSFIKA